MLQDNLAEVQALSRDRADPSPGGVSRPEQHAGDVRSGLQRFALCHERLQTIPAVLLDHHCGLTRYPEHVRHRHARVKFFGDDSGALWKYDIC